MVHRRGYLKRGMPLPLAAGRVLSSPVGSAPDWRCVKIRSNLSVHFSRGHMSFRVAFVAVVGLAACAGVHAALTPVTVRAQEPKSQWDGVYTRRAGEARREAVRGEVLELSRARHERRRDGAWADRRRVHVELERPVARRSVRADADLDAAEQSGQPEPPAERRHPGLHPATRGTTRPARPNCRRRPKC